MKCVSVFVEQLGKDARLAHMRAENGTYEANKAIKMILGFAVMECQRVFTAASTRQSAVIGSS